MSYSWHLHGLYRIIFILWVSKLRLRELRAIQWLGSRFQPWSVVLAHVPSSVSSCLPNISSLIIIIAHFAVFCLAENCDLSIVFSPGLTFEIASSGCWLSNMGFQMRQLEDGRRWPSLCQVDEIVPELGMKSCAEGHPLVPSGLFFSLMDCFLVCCQALNVLAQPADGSVTADGQCSCWSGARGFGWCLLLKSAARVSPEGRRGSSPCFHRRSWSHLQKLVLIIFFLFLVAPGP